VNPAHYPALLAIASGERPAVNANSATTDYAIVSTASTSSRLAVGT
jgi:hypothetical protein